MCVCVRVCGVVWCGVVWCGVVWCVVWCGVVWCGVVWCGVMWCVERVGIHVCVWEAGRGRGERGHDFPPPILPPHHSTPFFTTSHSVEFHSTQPSTLFDFEGGGGAGEWEDALPVHGALQ